jgi:hypothetical protein
MRPNLLAQGLPVTRLTATRDRGGIGVRNGYFFFGLVVKGRRGFLRLCVLDALSFRRLIVLEAERVAGGAGDAAGVVIELVFQVALIFGVTYADRVRIRR